jgi:transcription elongation GreA/GreB family factor
MATALLKKTLDDEVRVDTPGGTRHYIIIEVSYTPP